MIEGKAWVFGNDIDTDLIYPAPFMNTSDPAVMATHCMAGYDPELVTKIVAGDIFVGGKNFGCGSSREHAPIAIKASGVSCVIAASFARIFYRNAINSGLPILECPDAARDCREGDILEVDYTTGTIRNRTLGVEYKTPAFPPFIQEVIDKGGLIAYIDAGGEGF